MPSKKQKITSILSKINRLPVRIRIPIAAVLLFLVFYLALFVQEKPVVFSYAGNTCVQQLTLLPGHNKVHNDQSGYDVNFEQIFSIGDVKLLSAKTCFQANSAPKTGDTKLSVSLYGGWFAKKTYKINIPTPPVVHAEVLSQPISTAKKLVMPISAADLVFSYQLQADEQVAKCELVGQDIQCDVKSLNLVQGQEYEIKLVRLFDNKIISTLLNKNISTITATSVTESSIAQNQIIYDKPKTFTFNFDKVVLKSNVVLEKIESEKRTTAITAVTYSDKQMTVSINDDLDRNSVYEFTIDNLEAIDDSTLAQPYKLIFSVSGGPTISTVNVGTVNLPLTKTIILTFDQTLNSAQNIYQYVGVSGGIPVTISRQNNQVFISYSNASMCTDIGIRINAGLESVHGIVQNNSWSYTTRTTCHTATVIGYSKQGRQIIAYTFGSGSQTVLYTGAIHGNEFSTKYLMDDWVNELELNARNIHANKKIVVVPAINPDGLAAGSRNNSNNVDLNRNFPTADWQSDVYAPGNQLIVGGGGSVPLSEPESQVIAAFTIQLQPRLTMSFHGAAGYAIGNQAGDSALLAATYAQLVGYSNMTGVSGAFSYPITGTYDDWLREEYGLTSVLVELSSNYSSQFSKNKSALWAMANY